MSEYAELDEIQEYRPEFEESYCTCTHIPYDHGYSGCEYCFCEARWTDLRDPDF
jgi:hypothetical protein